MERIRKRIFGPSIRKDLKKTECAICTEPFSNGDELSALPCAHFFHKKCLDPWLERANTCPFCRRVVQAPKPAPASPPVRSRLQSTAWLSTSESDEVAIDALVLEGRSRLNGYLTRASERNVRRLSGSGSGSVVRQLGGGTVFLREAPDYAEASPRENPARLGTSPARARLGTSPARARLGASPARERLARLGTSPATTRITTSSARARTGNTPARTRFALPQQLSSSTNTTTSHRNTSHRRPSTTNHTDRASAAAATATAAAAQLAERQSLTRPGTSPTRNRRTDAAKAKPAKLLFNSTRKVLSKRTNGTPKTKSRVYGSSNPFKFDS